MNTRLTDILIVVLALAVPGYVLVGGNGNQGVPHAIEDLSANIANEFNLVHQKLDAAQTQRNAIAADLDAALTHLDSIGTQLGSLAVAGGMVPFTTRTPGGICNSANVGSANPVIRIDSDGDDPFVVTSVLVKTAQQPSGQQGYTFFSVNSVTLNGYPFDTRTGNLTAPVDGWAVQESADLMGTPIRRGSVSQSGAEGGNFPHQLVASGQSNTDISIRMFCRADQWDLSIEAVQVSGWKPPADNVSVVYVPGN